MLALDRLHARFLSGATPTEPIEGRRYTLTHSDRTGELFLSIGRRYDAESLRALQVRLERDEVLGEWVRTGDRWVLELHMMAQGGLPVFGTGSMRRGIFRYYRPVVLDAIGTADARLLAEHPELADAEVIARFHWRRGRSESESWGRLSDWV